MQKNEKIITWWSRFKSGQVQKRLFGLAKHINMCWQFHCRSADRRVAAHLLLRVLRCGETSKTVSSLQIPNFSSTSSLRDKELPCATDCT